LFGFSICLTLGFAGWMAYTAAALLSNEDQRKRGCGDSRGAYLMQPLSAILAAMRVAIVVLLFGKCRAREYDKIQALATFCHPHVLFYLKSGGV